MSVEAVKVGATVVVREYVCVCLPRLGHADGAYLAHPHTVAETGPAQHERRRRRRGSLDGDREQRRLQPAEQAADMKVALGDRGAALAADTKFLDAAGHAAGERLERD